MTPPRPAVDSNGRTRIDALDMTKGVLVLAMVVYHSLNYSQNYTLGFRYLPFLPPSFILITGFLISKLYFKTEAECDRRVFARLLFRGFRLLLLFTLLNVLTLLAGRGKFPDEPQGIGYLLDNWFEIYILGGGRFAAFSILLPIAYLLLLSPILLLINRWNRHVVPLLALGLVICCAVPTENGEPSFNLALLSAGLVGVVLGMVPAKRLCAMGRYWYVSCATYAVYIVVSALFWQSRFDQLFHSCLALAAIFSLCAAVGSNSPVASRVLILGKYSLLNYVLQIGVLQILVRLIGRVGPFSFFFFAQMASVLLFMIFCTEILNRTRKQSTTVDTLYRAILA